MRAVPVLSLLVALSFACFAAPRIIGEPAAPTTQEHAGEGEEYEESRLGELMLEINRTMRGFRNVLRNPAQMDKGAADACKLQDLALQAKLEVPHAIEEISDEAERRKEMIAYRQAMHSFLTKLFDLETALLEKDGKKAGGILRELGQIKNSGHERFQDEDH